MVIDLQGIFHTRASSVGFAALLSGKIQIKDQIIALVITSRNIASETYNRLIN